MAASGVFFNAWQGQVVRSSEARSWCLAHRYQQIMRFNLHEAFVLATSWAQRMAYIYQSSNEGLLADPDMARQAMERFTESADLEELASRGDAALSAEVQRIRAIMAR